MTRTMATASRVHLSLGEWPDYYIKNIQQESATRASDLLQENHEKHDIFFNNGGFHNHIAHHLLTIYSLNATPSQIQKHYDDNVSYQRPPQPVEAALVEGMEDPSLFKKYLGKERYYNDYLRYFQAEISKKGWQQVLNEYVFAGDERADDMLARMYAGFLHPIIHLGFGIEFHQPAIIAEGLAQAAVHGAWMKPLFEGAETLSKTLRGPPKGIVDLLDQTHAEKRLAKAADVDGNRIRDGIMKTEMKRMVGIIAQYRISSPKELDERTAEMTNAAAYFSGAAQRRDKAIKFDFFYMHCINASIFFSTFLKQDWLSDVNKVRLLQWKARHDIVLYASRGCPDLLLDEIANYKPSKPTSGAIDPWYDIIERVKNFSDDGHGSKLVRALAHGQQICKPYEENEKFRIKGDMWLQLGHMAIDSVEGSEPIWVRSAGFDSAWESIPDRPRAQL
ncbi:hypothetical protein E4T38_05602 [Aureobasidium subglaciale]|nr:hypothetical protein E4T38_05602 [Aureobasidium subglaciale]KAI5221258.1 hypothetical protein E4T40_05535 [Aureobasidium subglaciale]KAI5225275.1 hypothetical protein E4T41_05354 [Aureobasidium subglaciale]KAI5261374.1 hypothetical protein E4T46_05222 [Aureobasidium subglaciale]